MLMKTLRKEMIMTIDRNKHIWEGWTVGNFIDELEPSFNMIMNGNSWRARFESPAEVKDWCKDNQPYYKKSIPEVNAYFINKFNNYFK